jgi:hypothetical protein
MTTLLSVNRVCLISGVLAVVVQAVSGITLPTETLVAVQAVCIWKRPSILMLELMRWMSAQAAAVAQVS